MLLRDSFCHVATLVVMRGNGVRHGSFCTNGVPVITVGRKKSRIIIGGNLRMNNGQAGNCIGFSARCSLMALEGGCIYLGDSVGMSQAAICAIGSDITIGNHTLLGGGVKIYSSDFHSLSYLDRRDAGGADWDNHKCLPVTIGDDCLVGAGTIILKGVTIGDRTVIGAGSVVTGTVPADCIAGGNPCRVIRRLGR